MLTAPDVGGSNLTYRWSETPAGTSTFVGENSKECTVTPPLPTPSSPMSYWYTCEIQSNGVSVRQYTVNVFLKTNLRFVNSSETLIRESKTFKSNETVILTVPEVINDDLNNYPLKYEWSFNGEAIQGATSGTYAPTENGLYYCSITDRSGVMANLQYYIDVKSELDIWVNGEAYSSRDPRYTYLAAPGDSVEISINAKSAVGTIAYKWTYSNHDRTIKNQYISDQPVLKAADYGDYTCAITNGNSTTYVYIALKPDSKMTLKLDRVSLSSDGKITITGVATMQKANLPDKEDRLEVLLNGALKYIENGEVIGGDDYELSLDDIESQSNGQWSATQNVTEDAASITNRFTVHLTASPIVTSTTYLNGDKGEVRWSCPKTIFTYDGYDVSERITLNIPAPEEYQSEEIFSPTGSVKVQGNLPPGAEVVLGDVGTQVTSTMQNALKQGDSLIWLQDISVALNGIPFGFDEALTLSMWVSDQYNGQTMKVLHYKDDGQVEELSGTVTGGYLTFTTTSLSPFGVVASAEQAATPVAGKTGNAPKTGDASMSLWLLLIVAIAAGGTIAYMVIWQKKQKQN
ncbi:MAG: hypothetical protein RR559_04015 [Bacteroides sp.]